MFQTTNQLLIWIQKPHDLSFNALVGYFPDPQFMDYATPEG